MATTCNVRQNAIDYLKNKKVINNNMTIVSPLFYLENDKLTNYAKQKYGLKTEGSLFKSRRIVKQDIIRGGNAIPVDDVYKVDVNEELFKELQEQYDIVEQRKEDLGLVLNPLKEKTLNKATAYNSKLAKKLQNKLKQLYPEIKLNIENNPSWEYGDNILNQEDFDNSVNYRLKLIEGLLKLAEPKIDKRNRKYGEVNEPERLTIRLNTKERPNLETNIRKTLNNKGVTNQQVDFVFKYMRSNNIREISVSNLISEIANTYSYAIDINTSIKEQEFFSLELGKVVTSLIKEENKYYYIDNRQNKREISKDVWENLKKRYDYTEFTKHYSYLTVPGGINYRENEIATKDITPIRKGHAAFATDKGIGWFRSDEQVEGGKYYPGGVFDGEMISSTIEGGTPTKTRRILEVQSDLFQKNRDEKVLSKKLVSEGLLIKIKNRIDDKNKKLDIGQKFNIDGTWFEITDYKEGNNKLLYEVTNLRNKNTGFVSGTTIYEAVKKYYDTTLESDEFLQLLNKDNNWVTFFIKSIIQDSAKKGYEKVLFPFGDTASKVEGHSTLEEFKKEKQDRIAELKKRQNKIDSDLDQGFYGMDTSEYEISSNAISEEIEALEKELERVEGPEGFAALKPIYNFYQNIVTNVLKKQGYTPKEITDEYGNKWNEISLNQNRDLKNILLQKDEANQIIGQANINAMTVLIDSVNQKQDTLPHEYAHHYIAWFRNTSLVQEAISKWGSEEALVQSIGEQAVVQEGEAWNWWNSFVEWIYNLFNSLSNKDKQELTNILTDAFLKGIDLETGTVGISDERSRELAKAPSKVVEVKPGVEELFDSNPELANQVYEALGFATNNLQLFKNKLISIIGADKIKELYQNTDIQFNSFVIDDVELGTDKDLIITIKTDKGQRTAFNLRLDGDYQQLKISEGAKTIKGIYAPLSEKKTAIDFLISEFKNLGKEEITPQQKQQALQLYSQYLDTIFPDSKIKDIVYHGTADNFLSQFVPKEKGAIFFKQSKKEAQSYAEISYALKYYPEDPGAYMDEKVKGKGYVIYALINTINPEISDRGADHVPDKKIYDGFDNGEEIGVFKSEKIHRLGNKEDIEGFKEFVNKIKTDLKREVKPDVIELFKTFPELAKIGTAEQYSKYLDSIFPKNKILYHASIDKFDVFDFGKTYKSSKDLGGGFYLADKEAIEQWAQYAEQDNYRKEVEYQEKVYKDITKQFQIDYPLRDLDFEDKLESLELPGLRSFFVTYIVPTRFGKENNFNDKQQKAFDILNEITKLQYSTEGSNLSREELDDVFYNKLVENKVIKSYKGKKPSGKAFIIPVLADFSVPMLETDYSKYLKLSGEKISKYSAFYELNGDVIDQIVFKNPGRDTRILGTKQDIEGFKKFVSAKDNVKTKSLFDTNNKLANQIYNILNASEEEKADAEKLYLTYRASRNPNIEDGSEQDIQDFEKYFQELQDEYSDYDENIDVSKAENELFNDTETFGETFEEQDEDDGIEYQLTKDEPTVNQQPDQSIDEKIELFLQNIGVSLKSVNEIRDRNGNIVTDAIAKADMLNKIVEVVADRQLLDTLPEEAAHFFVNMLGENSPLYKQMFNKITDYKLYTETVEQYRKNKSYRKADGTLNIDKLKKEAIGKVIAQHIIGNDTGLETTQNANFLLNWWNKVWNFVKSFFVKADENPFETSAQQILEGNVKELSDDYTENEEYYQLADPFGGLIADQVNIKLDDSIDNRTGQKRHIYTYKDKPAKGSVTTYYVDAWLKKIFRSDQRSEAQKLIDLAKADFGDDVHLQIKKIFDSWLNEDGTKRSVQKSVERIVPAGPTYTILNNYVKSLLDTYDNKTRFLTEIKIFDQQKSIAGSIDLLVYNEDGSVDIYDWKSQEIYKDQEDIKAYKEPMYRIQLENYKKILEKQYGFKTFNKVRAVPIKTQFSYKNGQLYNIINIEIGNIDPTKIPEEKSYLLPVTLKEEKTENEDLDVLIKKLNGIYSKIETAKYPNEEKYLKREELNQLRLAIRDLRLKTRIDKLITFGLTQHKKYSDLLEENKLTGKDAENAIRILNVFEQSSSLLSEIREEYLEVLKEKGDKKEISKYEAVNKNFSYMSGQVRSLIKKIQKYQNQKVKEKAESKGIKGILDPEAQLNAIAGNFQALSNINRTSFKLFSNLLRKSQAIRDSRYEAALKKLVQLKKEFTDWADSKGLSTTEAMNKILQLDEKGNWNGNFLAKYEAKFYTEREEAIKTGNVKWFMDNVDYDIKNTYKEEEKKQRESLKKIQFFLDEKENKEAIDKKMKEWTLQHRVIDQNGKINFTALSNRQNRFVLPQDKWISLKWADLQKPENATLKKMYNYFQELTTYSKKIGMLDGNIKGFIPSMANDKLDQLVFGQYSKIFSTKGFFDNLEVDSGTMYTPQIDPTDGSIVNTIPVYFTSDYGVKREDGTMDYSKKSRDLFKVFGVWAGHMYNYEAMQTLEDDALMLLNVERNKPKLVTDGFNNVRVENGVVQAADKNDINSKVLEDFINYYLYNKQSDQLTDVAFKVGKKEYSLLKSVTSAMQWFSLKTLALNPISGTANFVGGTGNTLFTAQKGIMYTKKTWAEAYWRVTSRDKKAKAALDYFSVLAEGKSEGLINDLSLSTVNKYVNTNNAFLIQRKLDKAVEQPSAVALMLEHMIEDGKIVSIQQFVKNKYNYNETFYNLSKSERKALRDKIDKEVGELKKTRSLLEVGTINKDGEFELPGIEKESDAYADFRSKIKGVNKKIIGNQTREDINRIRTTMLGGAMMQFRNWIPELMEERFDGLKFDEELQTWTYGRARSFFGDIFSKRLPLLLKALATGLGETSTIELAKQKYQDLKAEAYEKGQPFDITEGEFVDLYIGNIKALMTEVIVLTGITASVVSVVGGDDDKKQGWKKYLSRALKKYYNEFAFYYNPMELTKIIDQPLPVIGLATDMFKFIKEFSAETAGRLTGNEEWIKEAKPLKYFNKMVPIGKEAMMWMAVVDDDFRKEWDIRIQ